MNGMIVPSNAHALSRSLFDNFFTNSDRAFFDGDHSFWRRNNLVSSKEKEDSYEHYVPLAGFKKENVSATASNGEVYVSARQGDSNASFSFLVAEDADVEGVSAKFEDGLLTVAVPKMASAQKINIEIK